MKSQIEKKEDGSIILTVTIPSEQIKKTREQVIESYVANAEIKGFRKGKAPRNVVEPKIDKGLLKEEILKKLLPEYYVNSVKEHSLEPIMNPQIHVQTLDEGKDWVFTAVTCEKPEVNLDGYKENISKITAKSKIIVPGKEPQPVNFEEIVRELLKSTTVKIPKVIIEAEVERLLSQTLDEIKKLGLSLDQYLASTGRTVDQLREEYAIKAQSDVKLEFVLQKIAEVEKITVDDKEMEEAISKAKTPEEKENLEKNKYLLASVLRQQKTLDFLRNL